MPRGGGSPLWPPDRAPPQDTPFGAGNPGILGLSKTLLADTARRLDQPHLPQHLQLIDFGTGAKGGGQPTSLGQAKKFLEIVQTYYGERLGRAVCINVPTLFWAFYRLVGPFVDPVTKDKIRFNPDVRTLVPPAQLDKEIFGGDYDFRYKHEEYFPFLDRMCREAREAKMRRWRERGEGKCGMSEFIVKGGMEQAQQEPDTLGNERKDVPALAGINGHHQEPNGSAGQSSPVPSTKPAGHQLPSEAQTAHSNDATLPVPTPINGIRPTRGDSNDSFVSAKEIPADSTLPAKARDDDVIADESASTLNGGADVMLNGGNHKKMISTDGIETGIEGLAVKEDGSIGPAS